MKQRDLYYLQELSKREKLCYVNLTQIGECAVAESTNGFCYLQIADKNSKRFMQGFFEFTGKGTTDEISLPKGYEMRSPDGKIIAKYQYSEPFNIQIGEQGEFTATFNREEMLFYLKYYLSTWRTEDAKKYMLVFHRDSDCWHLRGYNSTKKVKLKNMPINSKDTIQDTTFTFAVNPHTLRLIFKWFEGENITLYFHNGNYECKTQIFMRENNKLAVLMPIARKK